MSISIFSWCIGLLCGVPLGIIFIRAWDRLSARTSEPRTKPTAIRIVPRPDPTVFELTEPRFVELSYQPARHGLVVVERNGARYFWADVCDWRTLPSFERLKDRLLASELQDAMEAQLLRAAFPNSRTYIGIREHVKACDSVRFQDPSDKVVSTGYRTTETRRA
jgi:hypothetical protein